ncbi:uncharacterized protein LOC129257659 [Lytechinus pictus]|uniref:uncharacterized protein LOC129257659 n=1 Tax=Lytechinus pictus TaxID=7653 RepID=UPI0030B9CB51
MAGRIPGPSSGSQEALNSMISQLHSKVKLNEAVESQNRKRISHLQEENALLKRENSALKDKNSSLEKEMGHLKKADGRERDQVNLGLNTKAMSGYPGGSHYLGTIEKPTALSSPDVTGHPKGSSAPTRIKEQSKFCEEIFENKLSSCLEVKNLLQDLAAYIGKSLAQHGEAQTRESNLKLEVRNWHDISKYLLQFFALLQGIVISLGNDDDSVAPAWLNMALGSETDRSVRQQVYQIWRLMHWNIHHLLNNSGKPPAKSQSKIDKWFVKEMDKCMGNDDVASAVDNLLKSVSKNLGIVEEQVVEGLSMSISMETEEVSSGVSSSDSSISSAIPAEDLWTFRSLFQKLVEKIDHLCFNIGESQNLDDVDEMERDMYLPQREALENYDLGNLLRLMSSTIQSLSQEVVSVNAERGLCQRCGHDNGIEPNGDRINDHTLLSQRRQGQLPTGFNSAGPSGLKSRESTSQTAKMPLPPSFTLMSGGAMPKMPVAVRPPQGTFHGIRGPLPPKQLTVLQNSNPHARSKSDTFLSPQQKKVTDQSLLSKPSSLDSVFKRQSIPLGISTSPPSEIFSRRFAEHSSDSDDDYPVRGPPDTPPEVRSFEHLLIGKDSIANSSESSGKIDKLGAFSKYAMQSASQPRDNVALYDRKLPLSQVQQCTGDNSGTTQDMLLPSSVQWSSVQFKDGGMASPTLGAMSQLNTAQQRSQHMNYFSAIPQDSSLNTYSEDLERDGLETLTNFSNPSSKEGRVCPVCNMLFPDYVPMQAVQSHINLHFDESPGSFEVVAENYDNK